MRDQRLGIELAFGNEPQRFFAVTAVHAAGLEGQILAVHIRHFTQIRFDRAERRRKADSSALAQIGLLMSNSQGIPTAKRIRKTA